MPQRVPGLLGLVRVRQPVQPGLVDELQHLVVLLEVREQVGRLAEPTEQLEVGEGDGHLGLVPRVGVVLGVLLVQKPGLLLQEG